MWRRLSIQLQFGHKPRRFIGGNVYTSPSQTTFPFWPTITLFSLHFSSKSGENLTKKKVKEIMPIALDTSVRSLKLRLKDENFWNLTVSSPFRTNEAPALIKCNFDKRIIGCPGMARERKPYECPVCSR